MRDLPCLLPQDENTSGETAANMVKKDKMNYTMHKNDIVVGVRKGWYDGSIVTNNAYPHVVTTTANMCQAAQYWLMRLYNNTKNMRDLNECLNYPLKHSADSAHYAGRNVTGADEGRLFPYEQEQIDNMPQFYFMGVSLGLAYAHPDSGDTVGTVMYGGLRTVMNGPIRANTGQPCQWIFSFEAKLFNKKGERIFSTAADKLPPVIEDGLAKIQSGLTNSVFAEMPSKSLDRQKWNDRENGNLPGYPGKNNVILLIPYVRCVIFVHMARGNMHSLTPSFYRSEDGKENILDRERIVGNYISSAREYEMVDIKLQRQAI